MEDSDLTTCNKCGKVYAAWSLERIISEISKFNTWYESLPNSQKSSYSGRSSLKNYKYCYSCGNIYTNFRDYKKGDIPNGSTISTILSRKEQGKLMEKLYE